MSTRRRLLRPLEAQKGAAEGVASLDTSGKVPPDQIPSIITAQQLLVSGTARIEGNLDITGTTTLVGGTGIPVDSIQPRFRISDNSSTSALTIQQQGPGAILELRDANTSALVVTDSRNVGIGTTTPETRLHVVGNTLIEGNLNLAGLGGQIHCKDLHISGSSFLSNVAVGGSMNTSAVNANACLIECNSTAAALFVNQTGTGPLLEVRNNSASVLHVLSNGNVGVGISNPTSKLHVNGNLTTTGSVTAARAMYRAVHDAVYNTSYQLFRLRQSLAPLPQLTYDPTTFTFTVVTPGRFTFTVDYWVTSNNSAIPSWYVEVFSAGRARTKNSHVIQNLGSISVWGLVNDTFRIMLLWNTNVTVYVSDHGTAIYVQYS